MSLELKRESSIEEVNELMRKASLEGDLVSQLRYSTANDAVSSDFIGEPATAVFDSLATIISQDKKSITVYVWYDNEYGYALQVIRVAQLMAGQRKPSYY